MIVCVFDTETTSLEKPFCYNIGYVIADTDTREILTSKDFVVEQVWHNLPLFSSAYYAEKRSLYISAMRGKRAALDKWEYIMRSMAHDLREYNVECAYAYNSPFDDKVFAFNCDWYKTNNPLDNIPIYDIRGMVHDVIAHDYNFFQYCEKHERFTEKGNYSTTAETIYGYIQGNPDFEEAHTALADSEIECAILLWAHDMGANYATDYPVLRSLNRETITPFTIKVDGKVIYNGEYVKKYIRADTYSFTSPDRD